MKHRGTVIGIAFATFIAVSSTKSFARDSIEIGDYTYTCENKCSVNFLPNGSVKVTDTGGGYVHITYIVK